MLAGFYQQLNTATAQFVIPVLPVNTHCFYISAKPHVPHHRTNICQLMQQLSIGNASKNA